MPKLFFKYLFSLQLLLSLQASAQYERWEYTSKYTSSYTLLLTSSTLNDKYFEKREHIFALVKKPTELQSFIDKKLANRVFGVRLDLTTADDLTTALVLLKQFNKLHYLNLHLNIKGTFQLPDNIRGLQQLEGIEFNTANIDMDDALKKLTDLKNLHVLSFSGYRTQLPASVAGLTQIDSVKLHTTNIGNNKLNNLHWRKVHVIGDPVVWKDSVGANGVAEEKALLNLASIPTLNEVYFDDIRITNPSVIKYFTQITDLRGIFEGKDNPNDLLTALSTLKNVKTLCAELLYDKSISLAWLRNMPQLTYLYLGGHDIVFKDLDALGDLTGLESLTLHQFNLGIMPDIFSRLKHLKKLELALNGITKVPAGMFNLPALEYLGLMQNKLSNLPILLSYGCTNLKRVNLMMNNLTALPQAFTGLQNLESINCSSNKIVTTPGDWAYLTHLKDVEFSINHLTQFPEGLQNNHSVERISLAFNNIETLPDIEDGVYQLNYLDISGNRNVFALPDHIDRYTKLDTLKAQFLNLNELPEALGNCKNIKMLLLTRSIAKKTTLPAGLKDTKNLELLELNDNPLLDHQSVFDVILSQPRQNFRIDLSSNNITKLPASAKWLSTPFVSMSLRNNPINELPPALLNSKVKGSIDTKGTNIHP